MGVEKRAMDKDQGRCKLSFCKLVFGGPGTCFNGPEMKDNLSLDSYRGTIFSIFCSLFLGGFSPAEELKHTVIYVPQRGNQDPAPRLHHCFLRVPPWSLPPPTPFHDLQLFEPAFWNFGKVREAE